MLERLSYPEARPRMAQGDVIAFGGDSGVSLAIKRFTRSAVSHVGVILQAGVLDDPRGGQRHLNLLIESTQAAGFSGVTLGRLSQRLEAYAGEVWWLPLGQATRDRLDPERFYAYLLAQEGKAYDTWGALGAGLDLLLPDQREDLGRFFCSELVAAGLEQAGAVGTVNASEVTPVDLVRWHIYSPGYYQLKGATDTPLRGYNSRAPH